MKPLLLLTFVLFCFNAIAQQHKYDSILKKMIQGDIKVNNTYMVLNDKTKEVKPPGRDANGMLTPGIHVLPQDGMVCFVPPKTMIGLIPNFYEGKVGVPFTGNAPHIPNASPVIQSFQYHPLPKPVEK